MKMRMLCALICLGMTHLGFAATTDAVVEQPRPFGYVVGDLLQQRVSLKDFEPDSLPKARRVGVWFERRAAKLTRTADGQRWLQVEYQLINAPQELTTVKLPAWDLESKSARANLHVPEWPISVMPLTAASESRENKLGDLRADRAAPAIPTAPLRARFTFWLAVFLLTLAAWAIWLKWRDRRAAVHQPFARALRQMRGQEPSAPQVWHALHRAFDGFAHHSVQPESLPTLFQQAPQFLPLRSDIERFFAASSERFYGSGALESGIDPRALCAELRRIEKRNER